MVEEEQRMEAEDLLPRWTTSIQLPMQQNQTPMMPPRSLDWRLYLKPILFCIHNKNHPLLSLLSLLFLLLENETLAREEEHQRHPLPVNVFCMIDFRDSWIFAQKKIFLIEIREEHFFANTRAIYNLVSDICK